MEPDRRFACPVDGCDKRFKRKFTLHEHQKTHTGLRPFVCVEANCGKSFTTSGNLVRHAHTHRLDKPFACAWSTCAKRFCSREKLVRHLSTHVGLQPYVCHLCCGSFSTSGNLSRHMTMQAHASTGVDARSSMWVDLSQLLHDDDEPLASEKKQRCRIAQEIAMPRESVDLEPIQAPQFRPDEPWSDLWRLEELLCDDGGMY
ncbi:hypothetical protein SPRG_12110 [Saprolegnia parasitica CBS 223.65]|uniref:Wilms tumor protein homolog n=1 Tax=Saprolegnia parasitica (strain CBS 223.65) TaxID=695850 RepID=A0A067C6W2_SAPPC|nr:hypothetical protein SPRG_12110 [Saprolegnia parasitica CBS 223.65]KDO22271.1 hypothetical protein SPRG_12110 [Saprolegnia parasitica CBS 223.65]|eukprot:XP_012207007.1 hypothetical protein SPRG_12110 [Saprolegnia parasitica CBS 223.65]